MKYIILAAVLVVAILIGVIIGLSICKPEKEPAPPKVEIFPNPTSGISPVFFTVNVRVSSEEVELKKFALFFDDTKIIDFDVKEDSSLSESNFSINITGGKRFVDLSTQYVVRITGVVGKIFYFQASAENIRGKKGEEKKEVVVFENKPCTVQMAIVSPPRGDVIGLPPFGVQLGAVVSDDRCGSFSPQDEIKCDFKFIWDADNQGGEFQPDGETNQPTFSFTYQKLGIYTPRVKVVDDGGNECESTNLIPIYVARRIESFGFLPFVVQRPQVFAADLGDSLKLFSSRVDFGVQEYSFRDGRFIFDSSGRFAESVYGVDVGETQNERFLIYKAAGQIFGFEISGSYVNWNRKIFEISRDYADASFLHYPNFLTAIALFSGNSFRYFIPYPTFEFDFSTNLDYNFSSPYSIFREGNFLFFAHRVERQNKVVVYKMRISYDDFYKSYIVQGYEKKYEFDLDYTPTQISFFKEGGRIYIIISTGEQENLFASRTYIFDISSCEEGSCQLVNRTNITMEQVVQNIPHSEICPLSDPYNYNINILDFFIPQSFSLCGDKGVCILSLICLDRLDGGKRCEKSGIYPFMFFGGQVLKWKNCITFEPQSKIIYSWSSTSILYSGGFISAYDFSGNRLNPLDYESLGVQPESLSGFQTETTIYLSVGGIGGIEVLRFDRAGNFQDLDLHLYIKPDGKFADVNYSVKKHYLDENIIAAVLERSGCGEEWIFSGILIYDFRDKDSVRKRKPKIYKPYSELGIHSINSFYVKKLDSGRYKVVVGGTVCQSTQFTVVELDLDLSSFTLKEVSRLVFDSSPVSFEIFPSGDVVMSSPNFLYLIRGGKVEKELQGEGGGLLKLYQNILFEVSSEGNYIKIRTFGIDLAKIKEFSWYAGVYPSVSEFDVQSVIDEFFGAGSLDFIFVGLSIPQIYSKISALLVFDATSFVRTSGKEDINIFAVTPAVFDIGAKGMKYFRGAKNMVFLLDFSGWVFRAFLK
jgi:hypothetical protein